MTKYEVGVYRTSFNSIEVEADTEQEAKDFALRMEGTGELELFPDKRAEALIEEGQMSDITEIDMYDLQI